MRGLKAFALGAIAAGVVAYSLVAAFAVTAQVGGRTLSLTFGPLAFATVAREGPATVTTFGGGLVVLAFVGGLANLGAAHLLRRRSCPSDDRVD